MRIQTYILTLFTCVFMLAGMSVTAEEAAQQTQVQRPYLQMLKKQLLLSQDQYDAIVAIQDAMRADYQAALQKREAIEAPASFTTVAPDSDDYDKAVDATIEYAKQIAAQEVEDRLKQGAEFRKRIYPLLNEEQKKKFLILGKTR